MNHITSKLQMTKKILKFMLCTLLTVSSQYFIQAGEFEPVYEASHPTMDPKVEAQKAAEHKMNIDLIQKTKNQISDTSWNNNKEKTVKRFDPTTKTSTNGTANPDGSFNMNITKPKIVVDTTTGEKSTIEEPVSRITQDSKGNIDIHELDSQGNITKTSSYKFDEFEETYTPTDKQQAQIAEITTNLQPQANKSTTLSEKQNIVNQAVDAMAPKNASDLEKQEIKDAALKEALNQDITKPGVWENIVQSISDMLSRMFSSKGSAPTQNTSSLKSGTARPNTPTSITGGVDLFA